MAVALSTIIFLPLSASPGSDRTAASIGVAHRSAQGTPGRDNRFAGRSSLGRRTAMRTLEVALESGGEADSSSSERERVATGAPSRTSLQGASQSRSERCKPARTAAIFFRLRTHSWQALRDGRLASKSPIVAGKSCHWAKFAAHEWAARARSARRSFYRWLNDRTLRDFRVTPGSSAWFRAVEEAQRAYPGTAWWLKSCSASEGGWGRWVPNSDGAPPGGWMQMYESTFWRMWGTAWRDVTARGFRVPHSAHSWYSPLGQALASAWGLTNGRRGEWNSSGC